MALKKKKPKKRLVPTSAEARKLLNSSTRVIGATVRAEINPPQPFVGVPTPNCALQDWRLHELLAAGKGVVGEIEYWETDYKRGAVERLDRAVKTLEKLIADGYYCGGKAK